MRLKVIRDKIAWFIASKEGKKNLTEGVTDDNFYDFSFYVDLISKSLRRLANDRIAFTVLNYNLPDDWDEKTHEDLEPYAEAETVLLNKWADILDIDTSDIYDTPMFEPYFDALEDKLFGSKQDIGSAQKELGRTLDSWENSILYLKSDILAEIGTNYMYFWD